MQWWFFLTYHTCFCVLVFYNELYSHYTPTLAPLKACNKEESPGSHILFLSLDKSTFNWEIDDEDDDFELFDVSVIIYKNIIIID